MNRRLHGWKEIAAYLGRSVRSAHRWHRELGLPVHHILVKNAESAYAESAEIDAWLKSRDNSPDRNEFPSESTAPTHGGSEVSGNPVAQAALHTARISEPASATSILPPSKARRRISWIAVALAVALVGVAGQMTNFPEPLSPRGSRVEDWAIWPRPPIPYRLEVRNNALIVFDRNNQQLWEHVFSQRLNEEAYRIGGHLHSPLGAIDDLDGDGRPEVLFSAAATPTLFYCFNHDRSLRFEQSPIAAKHFGDKAYFGPFESRTFHITSEADGRKTLWLVRTHHKEYPSVLQKLDANGQVLAEYWSSGHIHRVEEGKVQGRRVVFAGGVSNEHELAGNLAVLDYENPSGSAPSLKDYYRCRDCPAGKPLAYLIFPRMEVSYATAGSTAVKEIKVEVDGSSRVELFQGGPLKPGDPHGPPVFYFLDSAFRVLRGELASNFVEQLRLAASQGRFNRKLSKAPQTELFPVLAWDGEKYVPQWPQAQHQ